MKIPTLLLLMTLSIISQVSSYHILVLSPVPSRSHSLLGKGIADALLKAGHEVTWATPYPVNKPQKRLNIIDVSATVKIAEGIDMTDPRYAKSGMAFVMQFARNVSTVAANDPGLRQAIVKNKYDAVVTEWFFSDVDAGYAAALQVPWIMLSGIIMHPHLEELVDEVRSVATIPLMFNNLPNTMNFWQRLFNTATYLLMKFSTWRDYPMTEALYKSFFSPLATARGATLPPFNEALYNVSILLVNSHPSIAPVRSLPPNVVDIAGYHIAEDIPPLPKDLQDILDSSPQGVVYFSMGSVLKSAALPAETKRDLLKVLGELPYTVLWKFEEELKDLPKNVHIRPWMPQSSILAHKNVRVFVTHGGLLSSLEAIQSGVPLVVVPVFGDQPANAKRAVDGGYALQCSFENIASDLRTALREMLANDTYYRRAQTLSTWFRARPVPPSKLIAHYVELAIQTKGAYHLRSKSLEYAWYQRYMLDQITFVLAVLYIIFKVLSEILKRIFSICKKDKGIKDKGVKDKGIKGKKNK